MIRLISQWDFRTALRTAHDAYNNVLDGQVPNEYRIIQMQMFSDMPFVLCTAVFIYFLRKFLSNNIFTSLADYWNVPKSKRQRFIENAWFSLYYSLMVAMSMYALWDTPWLWDFEQIYKGFPNEHLIDDDIYPMTKIYRLIAFAFYSQALFTLVYVDERMKDFGEMLMHHITTLALMIVSNVTGIHRLGSMIVLIHDIGDVFLYSAKAFHEADKQIPANLSFFLFTVTFLPLRLIYLPYTVIHFILTPVRTLFPGLNYIFGRVHNAAWPVEISNYGLCLNRYCLSTMWFLGFAMLVLFCLHCYWFKLTLNVLVKALSHGGNVQGDPRHKDYTDKKKRESARSQS